MRQISVIVPCYNEEESLPFFYREIKNVMNLMRQYRFELLFIDDGSKDETLSLLKRFRQEDDCVHYISFSRNFGKESAIYAGLKGAKGDYVVLMDADLQDPPALLPEMAAILESEEYDSVAFKFVKPV